jgi:SAM-dependent methyltransferase
MKISEALTSFNTKSPEFWGVDSVRHLDMGCGAYARNPFKAAEVYGADLLDHPPFNINADKYYKVDSKLKIPVEDGFFNSISAYDFIEHLNRSDGYPNSFITFMNEASRVLKEGGVLLGVTPAFPSPVSFQDPTHVNIITEATVNYFLNRHVEANHLEYGFTCRFELVAQFWAGPFSAIRKPEWISDGLKPVSIWNALKSPSSFRRHVAGIRNPSHLVWVLRKV